MKSEDNSDSNLTEAELSEQQRKVCVKNRGL
jgi:hypothetical protein